MQLNTPKLKYNPYNFQIPVKDPAIFIGRDAESFEIKYYMDQTCHAPLPVHIALIGERASGKSSILNMMKIWASEKQMLPVMVKLADDDAKTQLAFFFKIFDALLLTVAEQNGFGGIHGAVYETYTSLVHKYETTTHAASARFPFLFPRQYALAMQNGNTEASVTDTAYERDFQLICTEAKRPIMLLIDDAGFLANCPTILQKLRNNLMMTPGLMVALAATPDVLSTMNQVFSPIVRQVKKITLATFADPDDTEALIRAPLERLGYKADLFFNFADKTSLYDVHDLSGGRPYEIQLICHTLFRRVEEERANKMTLDYTALEEIRKELSFQHDLNKRPLLAQLKGLEPEHLRALGLVANCSGTATVDQLISIRFVINGEQGEGLPEAVQELVRRGFVAQDGNYLRTIGDEFDRFYIKYFAREFDIAVDFIEQPIDQYFASMLKKRIERLAKGVYILTYNRSGDPLEAYSKILTSIGDPHCVDDLFSSQEDIVRTLYLANLECQAQGAIQAKTLFLKNSWLQRPITILPMLSDEDAKLQCEGLFKELEELVGRAKRVGWAASLKRSELPIQPPGIVVENLRRSANRRLRQRLAEGLTWDATIAYLEGNIPVTARKANEALELRADLPGKALTNLGYLFMRIGEAGTAQDVLKQAVDMPGKRPLYPALPMYNLAMLKITQGAPEAALLILDDVVAGVSPSDRAICKSLLIPVREGSTLGLTEHRLSPDLISVCRDAREIVFRFLQDRTKEVGKLGAG